MGYNVIGVYRRILPIISALKRSTAASALRGGTCCLALSSRPSSEPPETLSGSERAPVPHSGPRAVRSSGTRCPGWTSALGYLCSSSS